MTCTPHDVNKDIRKTLRGIVGCVCEIFLCCLATFLRVEKEKKKVRWGGGGNGGCWMGVGGGKKDHWPWYTDRGWEWKWMCATMLVWVCVCKSCDVFPPWWRAGVKVYGSASAPQPEGPGPCWQQSEGRQSSKRPLSTSNEPSGLPQRLALPKRVTDISPQWTISFSL